jgi:methenyltetrahydrofolate cyclohydrolase
MGNDFLSELAQARPDPGGGAAAAYGARVALALLLKVVRLELARGREAESCNWGELLAQAQEADAALVRLQHEDVRAYFGLTQARAAGNPHGLAAAVGRAVEVPRSIMAQAGAALTILAAVGGGCKKHLVSDLLVACELLGGAFRGADHIAGANLPLIADVSGREALSAELARTRQAAEAQYRQTQNVLLRR